MEVVAMAKTRYERECIEVVLIFEDKDGVFWEDSYGVVTLSEAIDTYLQDNDENYKRAYQLRQDKVISYKEFMRIRHNAWRRHKKILAKQGKRITRVYMIEAEIL